MILIGAYVSNKKWRGTSRLPDKCPSGKFSSLKRLPSVWGEYGHESEKGQRMKKTLSTE